MLHLRKRHSVAYHKKEFIYFEMLVYQLKIMKKKIHDFDYSALGGLSRYLTQLSSFEALLLKSIKITCASVSKHTAFLDRGLVGLVPACPFFQIVVPPESLLWM